MSPALNAVAQRILRWAEVEHHPDASVCSMEEQCSGGRSVSPQPGSRLGVDAPSGCVQLAPPVLAGDNRSVCILTHCSVYFAPVSDPMVAGTDVMLQSWDSLQAYAFPPFAMIGQVLAKVRSSQGLEMTLIAPLWPQRLWFPELLELLILSLLPSRWDLLCQPHSDDSIKTCPCFVFMRGDSPEIRESLRLLS